jgi:hypothetical protein
VALDCFRLKFQNAAKKGLLTHSVSFSLADFMVDETSPVNTCWEAYRRRKKSEQKHLKMIMKK